MANGSGHEGPARRDRIVEIGAKYDRWLQRAVDEERAKTGDRDLPNYRESDSEITANAQGLHARGIPRFAWWMLGLGIMVFIAAAGVALVVALM